VTHNMTSLRLNHNLNHGLHRKRVTTPAWPEVTFRCPIERDFLPTMDTPETQSPRQPYSTDKVIGCRHPWTLG
jgi:hypothetical protein